MPVDFDEVVDAAAPLRALKGAARLFQARHAARVGAMQRASITRRCKEALGMKGSLVCECHKQACSWHRVRILAQHFWHSGLLVAFMLDDGESYFISALVS